MRKSTIIFIVSIVLVAVVSILIPVSINYQDAGASNVENDGVSTQRHEIDKTLESAIDLLPAKYMNRIARVVKDTLDMYFREHFDVAGDLISGLARGAEALLLAVAVALGNGAGMMIWIWMGGIIG